MKKHIIFAIATVALGACAKKAADDVKEPGEVGATIEAVTAQHFSETVDAVGAVVARAGHVASLSAPSPTRVSKVFVTFGAHVKAGDPLVEFEQPAFDAAAKGADAALAAAEKSAERTKRLADAGVLPRKDAEAATADLGAAQLNAVNARRAQQLSTLRSPIDGVVTRLSAVLGASADPTQVMVEVSDPTALDAMLTLSPSDAARVHVGEQVALHDGAAATGKGIASGRVADVSAAIDTTTRGVGVRVEVASGGNALRIGQTVFGRIAIAEHDHAIVVPIVALVPTGEDFKVFVTDEKGIAQSRPVKIGGRTDHDAWITDGLKAGEKIVTDGAYGVDDSTKVVTAKEEKDAKPAAADKKGDKKDSTPATASKKP